MKLKIQISVILIPLFFFCHCEKTEDIGSVVGIITENNLPISNAEITISEINKIEYSNEKGEFCFLEVPVGNYEINIQKDDYIPYSKESEIFYKDYVDSLNIKLEMTGNKVPILSIQEPEINDNNEIILNASIDNLLESGEIFSHGFVWSEQADILSNPNYTNLGTITANGQTHNFTYTYENFDENITYFIKAYASNRIGKSFSETKTFKINEQQQEIIFFITPTTDNVWISNNPYTIVWQNVYSFLETYPIDIYLYSASNLSEPIMQLANQINNSGDFFWEINVEEAGYYFLQLEIYPYANGYDYQIIKSNNFQIQI